MLQALNNQIMYIASARLNQCPAESRFMEQRFLIWQETLHSLKYFFDDLDHSTLHTTEQEFHLNLTNFKDIWEGHFSMVFAIWSAYNQLGKAEIRNGSKFIIIIVPIYHYNSTKWKFDYSFKISPLQNSILLFRKATSPWNLFEYFNFNQ